MNASGSRCVSRQQKAARSQRRLWLFKLGRCFSIFWPRLVHIPLALAILVPELSFAEWSISYPAATTDARIGAVYSHPTRSLEYQPGQSFAAAGDSEKFPVEASQTDRKAVFEVRFAEISSRANDDSTYDSRKVAPGLPTFSSYDDPKVELLRLPFSQLGSGTAVAGNVEIQRFGVTNQWASMSQDDFKKFMAWLQTRDGIDLLSGPKFAADLGVMVYRGMWHTNAISTGRYRTPPEVDYERVVPKIEWTTSLPSDRTDFVSHSGTNFFGGVSVDIVALHDKGQWRLKVTGIYDEFLVLPESLCPNGLIRLTT